MQILGSRKRAAPVKRGKKDIIAGIVADLVRGNCHLCIIYNVALNGMEKEKNGLERKNGWIDSKGYNVKGRGFSRTG